MSYQTFREMRRPLWNRLGELLADARRRPKSLTYGELEELTVTYRQVLHDYSVASSRYPGSGTARELRRLVLDATHFLQRDTGARMPSIRRFISEIFPRTVRRLGPTILVAALLFCTLAGFGFSLTAIEPSVGLIFLPAQVLAELDRGELWTESIFAVTPGAIASSKIATNNLSVAITAWAGGILGGLGSLWILCLNGLMLGSVLALTAHYSMAGALLEFIGAHGPLELTMIVVSAGAGLHMGAALVRATDEPRAKALTRAGGESLVVLFGCLPWLLVLGFVEGFLSPSADLSMASKWAVGILLELVFLLWCLSGRTAEEERRV